MLKNIRFIAVTISLLFLSVTASQAVVQLVDIESTGVRNDLDNNITQGVVASGSGLPGDFVVTMCSTFSDGNNLFLEPTPGDWLGLDSGECGGSEPCILGIFGTFVESADSSDITCRWTDQTSVFAAGTFRYAGVDPDNPIIAVACNTGAGGLVVAPSVDTEPGSAVIGISAIGASLNLLSQDIVGFLFAQGVSSAAGQIVIEFGESLEFPHGGPTGEIVLAGTNADWRACTIALRMEPTNIPTLSEWGLGIFASLFGVAAVWALRRRAVKV